MPSNPPRSLIWTGYLAFALIGVYVSAIGPGLPGLATRTHIPLDQAGTLLTALFAGGLMTSAAAGRALDRYGRRPVLVAGSVVNGLGCLLLPLATSWPQALAAGVLLGVGDGMLVVGWQVLFVDLHPADKGGALSRINVYFGVGALIGPALVAASIKLAGDFRYAMWIAAAGQALTACVALRVRGAGGSAPHAEDVRDGFRHLGGEPLMWTLCGLIAVYVAAEAAIGAWTFSYLHTKSEFTTDAASFVASAYWLALTAGRALSPFVLRRMSDRALLLSSAALSAAAGLALTALAGWGTAGAVCILCEGLVFGPIWPMTLAVGTAAYPRSAGAVSGVLATAGAIGGIIGPWLQGILLGGGVHRGMAFALVSGAGMAALAAAALRLARDEARLSAPAATPD